MKITNKALIFPAAALAASAFFSHLQNEEEFIKQASTLTSSVQAAGDLAANYGSLWVKSNDPAKVGNHLEDLHFAESDAGGYGTHFYQKNPFLIQREMAEMLSDRQAGFKIRLSSDNPMNPSNKSSEAEARAIRQFKDNPKLSFVNQAGLFSTPIKAKASCLKCHDTPERAPSFLLNNYGSKNGYGYKEGDVVGVLSVSRRQSVGLLGCYNIATWLQGVAAAICLVLALSRRSDQK